MKSWKEKQQLYNLCQDLLFFATYLKSFVEYSVNIEICLPVGYKIELDGTFVTI